MNVITLLNWVNGLFYACIGLTLVWLWAWRAVDKASFQEAIPDVLRFIFSPILGRKPTQGDTL